ncbi:methyltransferase protein [Ceratobasidium sp. 370]|nr:methyltransferase protein [Ceratobasidium sp. 370]
MEAELWRAGGGFQRKELNIVRNDQAEYVIGFASDWLELDSLEEGVRFDSEIALRQELQFASYLGIANIILPAPRRNHQITSYARTISDCLASSSIASYINLSIRVPVCDVPPEEGSGAKGVTGHEDELSTTWEMWNTIRTICGPTQRVSVALDLTPALPASPGILARWAAEPIQHLILPATTFIPNAKGYPVLPKLVQSFLRDVLKNRLNIILSQTTSGLHKLGGDLAYAQYVRHLEKTSPTAVAREAAGGLTVESFGRGYEDYLQAPLQPLMDNLASVTYEIFEKDPVKYRQYEQAVYQALLDRPQAEAIIICVAGAGRGPIVSNCIRAVERAGCEARIYAVEKNPSAFVTLQGRKAREWPDNVFIKFGDMRSVQLPEPVDILVSELLGSFGDNELSPECLDGAVRLLKPEGISIPASYTAYLAPLSASMLYNDPSQVALPGGKTDPTDGSPVETALREAHEEVGLPMSSRHVHILGLLTPFLSLYKLAVTPVVAILTDLSVLDTLRPNPDEVDEIFDHPLEAILSPGLVASIGTSPSRPLSEHGGPSWPYQSEFHDTTDAQWWRGTWYRMHRYRSTTTPIKGLTSDILILAAQIAYDRDTDYERYAKNQATFATSVEWAMEHHATDAQKSLVTRPETREIHTYGLAH